MEDVLSESDNSFEDEDDYDNPEYNPERDDYLAEIVRTPKLTTSMFDKDEQVISFMVRSQNGRLAFGKAELITETGESYPVTIIIISNIQPAFEALQSGSVTIDDQGASILSTDIPIHLAQKARKLRQYQGSVKKEE